MDVKIMELTGAGTDEVDNDMMDRHRMMWAVDVKMMVGSVWVVRGRYGMSR
jgi:hypothetical protein